ncbi:hypothetical protein ES332_A10G221100v1 [Gossypium tomentosum]|uniref:Uncharacterized protein n=1 Tax=Gossypium tomentosum TaxID=34277 RepID=A0A5D2NWB5_GOSTO|nr:hypothetical protein ES332_A10G221100v1 [Gossypium tomentosum]
MRTKWDIIPKYRGPFTPSLFSISSARVYKNPSSHYHRTVAPPPYLVAVRCKHGPFGLIPKGSRSPSLFLVDKNQKKGLHLPLVPTTEERSPARQSRAIPMRWCQTRGRPMIGAPSGGGAREEAGG